jgi:hypothetical protein
MGTNQLNSIRWLGDVFGPVGSDRRKFDPRSGQSLFVLLSLAKKVFHFLIFFI